VWAKILPAFALAAVVVAIVPRAGSGGVEPPIGIVLSVGLLVGAMTTGALYWGLRTDLGMPARMAAYAVAYNLLVVVVKFVLAPRALYEANRGRELVSLLPVSEPIGAIIVAGVVFLLYAAVLFLIYRFARRRVWAELASMRNRRRTLVLAVFAGAVLLGTAFLGWAVVVIPLLLTAGSVQYLDFVFSSGLAFVIALVLVAATSLAAVAMRSVADRAEILGDVALLVSFFWIGLTFLALYHVVWVVYVLVLTSVWPLKVVIPK
jgi:hypothetical protein